MNSSAFKLGDVCVVSVNEDDFYDDKIGINLLEAIREHKVQKTVLDVGFQKVLQSADIKIMDNLSKLFMLNNVSSVFCGFNEKSLCAVVHFIDDFSFHTAPDVERAIDALESRN